MRRIGLPKRAGASRTAGPAPASDRAEAVAFHVGLTAAVAMEKLLADAVAAIGEPNITIGAETL
jgi:hypothetical protein